MTRAAGSDLRFGRMAREAIIVCLKSDRDRFTGAGGLVTRCTPGRRPAFAVVVGAVVELHIKPFSKLSRKGFHRRRISPQVTVTDRAHDLVFVHQCAVGELIQMTADAGIVCSELHVERTPFALVARVAFELFVLRDRVREGLECLGGRLLGQRFGCFGRGQRDRRFCRLINATRRKRDDRAENKASLEQIF